MHLLKAATGTFKSDIQLEVPAGKLAIKISSASGGNAETFDTCKISVQVSTKSGTKTILPKMLLLHALEMSALGEGYFVKNNTELSGCIDLSDFGALAPTDGYLSISYEGFPADAVTDIYAVDVPVNTNIGKVVEEFIIQGTKEISINNKTEIFIPVSDGVNGIEEITVTFPGKVCTYNEAELSIINDGKNDLLCAQGRDIDVMAVTVDDGEGVLTLGFKRLLSLDISEAFSVKIKTLDDSKIKIYTTHNQIF